MLVGRVNFRVGISITQRYTGVCRGVLRLRFPHIILTSSSLSIRSINHRLHCPILTIRER